MSAGTLWRDEGEGSQSAVDAAAYRKMLDEGSLDRCGVTLLAGKAVGAPFVVAIAATLVLAEVLRLLHGGALHRLIDMNVIDLAYVRAVPQLRDFSAFNPGFITAEGSAWKRAVRAVLTIASERIGRIPPARAVRQLRAHAGHTRNIRFAPKADIPSTRSRAGPRQNSHRSRTNGLSFGDRG
jgi:hypothetical protein